MTRRRGLAAICAVLTVAAVIAGCTSKPVEKAGASVTVAVTTPFTSYNPMTSFGATTVNQQVAYATNSNFVYADNRSRLVDDSSFGTVTKLSDSPLTVRYAIASGVKWSDGSPVDASDLLLAWAANSRAFNTAGFSPRAYENGDGLITKAFPAGVVWFDAATKTGLENATAVPTVGDDNRSITVTYDRFFTDWRTALAVGLPAHVVGARALRKNDPTAASAAVSAAITGRDNAALAKVARTWDSAFSVRKSSIDVSLLVGTGPYAISSVAKDGTVTLERNAHYTGDHRAHVPTIVIRPISNRRTAVRDLAAGTVDVITPSATSATVDALLKLSDVTVSAGLDATFDHLDLQQKNGRSGVFDDRRLRIAFLKTVPRSEIVARVVGSLQDESSPRSSFVFFPGTTAYTDAVAGNGSAPYDAVDIAGARALVKASGVRSPKVCVLYDTANPVRVAEYSLVKKSADKAGFDVTDCGSTEWASQLGKKGAYDAALFGWRYTSSAVTAVAARLHSGVAALNYNFYASSAMDALLDRLSQTSDEGEQNAILLDIDRTLFADGYGLPLFQLPSITAYRTSVTGIARSPFAPGVFWNIWDWRSTR